MRYLYTIPLVLVLLLTVACVPVTQRAYPTGDAVVPAEFPDEVAVDAQPLNATPDVVGPDAVQDPHTVSEDDVYFTVRGTEGDLIRLNPQAIDPDGDVITFEFTKPFNERGEWQTTIGDEGDHYVAVAASDGKSTTTETVHVIVDRANRPPVIDCAPITVKEGERIDLHDYCKISDEDGDEVVVTYTGWIGALPYTIGYDEAGRHVVRIKAGDKQDPNDNVFLHTVVKNITIDVQDVNRPPIFADEFPSRIAATENDVITLPRDLISDPDGDKVTVTYSDPFDRDGVWKTKLGDAGSYTIDVVASDGTTSAKRTVTIDLALRNTAPTLKHIGDITVKEGETIKLPISATDREGDPLTITVAGWMRSDTYKTTYDDAGEYTVKVIVTDGTFTTDQIVHITVQDVNRPPVFVTPA